MKDRRATVEFTVRDALASTAHVTGLVFGAKSEALVKAIVDGLFEPAVAWIWQENAVESEQTLGGGEEPAKKPSSCCARDRAIS
jgi:hypothetical protein